jgi:hypothetical protein
VDIREFYHIGRRWCALFFNNIGRICHVYKMQSEGKMAVLSLSYSLVGQCDQSRNLIHESTVLFRGRNVTSVVVGSYDLLSLVVAYRQEGWEKLGRTPPETTI